MSRTELGKADGPVTRWDEASLIENTGNKGMSQDNMSIDMTWNRHVKSGVAESMRRRNRNMNSWVDPYWIAGVISQLIQKAGQYADDWVTQKNKLWNIYTIRKIIDIYRDVNIIIKYIR